MNNRRPLTLLVTGFGPFPGVTVNPTERMARRLSRSRRFARLGAVVVAHVFPTRWAIVERDLPELLARVKPDAALHLGVAARRRRVTIETVARPTGSRIAPDAGGRSAAPMAARAARSLPIAAPAPAMLACFRRSGAPAALSNDAGRYLCNALYHQSLALRAERRERRPTLFAHVPQGGGLRSTIPRQRLRTAKPGERAILRGLEQALLALLRAAR